MPCLPNLEFSPNPKPSILVGFAESTFFRKTRWICNPYVTPSFMIIKLRMSVINIPTFHHDQVLKATSICPFSSYGYTSPFYMVTNFGPIYIERHLSEICFALHGAGLSAHRTYPICLNRIQIKSDKPERRD